MTEALTGPEHVQLLCLDVDGVLTDGSILIDHQGMELKRFFVRDGIGLRVWMKLGLQGAIDLPIDTGLLYHIPYVHRSTIILTRSPGPPHALQTASHR